MSDRPQKQASEKAEQSTCGNTSGVVTISLLIDRAIYRLVMKNVLCHCVCVCGGFWQIWSHISIISC